MKKINFTLLVCLLLAGIFASCDDDDKYPVPPEVSIESVNGVFAMPQEDSIVLKAKVESPLPTTLSWSVKGNEVSKDTVFTALAGRLPDQGDCLFDIVLPAGGTGHLNGRNGG